MERQPNSKKLYKPRANMFLALRLFLRLLLLYHVLFFSHPSYTNLSYLFSLK